MVEAADGVLHATLGAAAASQRAHTAVQSRDASERGGLLESVVVEVGSSDDDEPGGEDEGAAALRLQEAASFCPVRRCMPASDCRPT